MIWGTSIWRRGCSNHSKIRSAQKCYPCLRYGVSERVNELRRGTYLIGCRLSDRPSALCTNCVRWVTSCAACFLPSGFRSLHRSYHRWLPPAETNPLLNVVGQTGPQCLHDHFGQAAQSKLSQADLSFDPGIWKFRHRATLPIDLFRLFGGHFDSEGCDRWRFLRTHYRPSCVGVGGTAVFSEFAVPAIS